MQWIAPSEKDATNDTLEKRLWAAADQLRANSGPNYLRFADLNLLRQNANPRRTRDLLLPRMLSGQVNIEQN